MQLVYPFYMFLLFPIFSTLGLSKLHTLCSLNFVFPYISGLFPNTYSYTCHFFLSTRHYITCCTWVQIVIEHTLYITCHFFISNWAICLRKYSRMLINLFICLCSVWAFTFEEKEKCLCCICQLHWVVDKRSLKSIGCTCSCYITDVPQWELWILV